MSYLQEGASDEEINALSKFTFCRTGSFDNGISEKTSPSKGIMVPVGSPEGTKGRLLTAENAVCAANSHGFNFTPIKLRFVSWCSYC
jgi:hypothetical protein